jgi:hypothetical protein
VAVGMLAFAGLEARQKTTEVHPGMGGSPHVKTEWTVGGANISIEYGRPHLKGRTIGKDIVPFGQVWRAGADQATTLTSSKALVFGTLTVPAGSHTLWILPSADKWVLIVNKQTGQWGTAYDGKQDLGRADMSLGKPGAPAEQHTIAITAEGAGGVLQMTFGNVQASVPFTVGSLSQGSQWFGDGNRPFPDSPALSSR